MKTNDMINQTLDQTGGDIISSKIILPFGEFNTYILMKSPFGKYFINGGSVMRFLKKFRIAFLIYTIFGWCLGLALLWITFH